MANMLRWCVLNTACGINMRQRSNMGCPKAALAAAAAGGHEYRTNCIHI